MIENYFFGSMTVSGKTYNFDVEVRSNGEVLQWQRAESHIIDVNDVKRAVNEMPKTIVIGTGEAGLAEITSGARDFITKNNILLISGKTKEAVEIFNELLKKKEKVIGLFHLTC